MHALLYPHELKLNPHPPTQDNFFFFFFFFNVFALKMIYELNLPLYLYEITPTIIMLKLFSWMALLFVRLVCLDLDESFQAVSQAVQSHSSISRLHVYVRVSHPIHLASDCPASFVQVLIFCPLSFVDSQEMR